MNAIAYCHPFVPPEWIAAHGLRPKWLPCRAGDEPAVSVRRGVCPVAAGLMDAFAGEPPADAVVLTTTCDQIRYAAAVMQHQDKLPVFLLHVPRTWQTPGARAYYRDELSRLGRFLVGCGGREPRDDMLTRTVLCYESARAELRLRRAEMTAAAYAQEIAVVRGDLQRTRLAPRDVSCCQSTCNKHFAERDAYVLPLALVGGPLSPGDYQWLTAVEKAGARFVLDATESGERTLPPPVDADRLAADPREELARIYFDGIPMVFQRPNDRLYDWLREQLAARGVRGIVARRYVWCDHWHGELPRLREEFGVPVLDWDGAGEDPHTRAGAAGRMEAFLEMLR
jgi:benzoyl-CoA reductase/2-hydroxyglutaryl-CoA dehydratase subunit BcrC/BadD/HgdB